MRNSKFEMRNQIAQRIRIADQEALNQSTFATSKFAIRNSQFEILFLFIQVSHQCRGEPLEPVRVDDLLSQLLRLIDDGQRIIALQYVDERTHYFIHIIRIDQRSQLSMT